MERVAAMKRLYELINAGDIDGFGDQLADGFVEHEQMAGLEPTREGVKQLFRMYRATGTHTGEDFMEVPASGKSVNVQLIDITRFDDDGLAHEHWGLFDALSMM